MPSVYVQSSKVGYAASLPFFREIGLTCNKSHLLAIGQRNATIMPQGSILDALSMLALRAIQRPGTSNSKMDFDSLPPQNRPTCSPNIYKAGPDLALAGL